MRRRSGRRAPGTLLLLASTGIVTAVPLICFGAAATRVPMTTLGLLQYLAPVLQFALGVFVLDEAMPASRWIGFVLVWIALVIFTVEATNHHRRQPGSRPWRPRRRADDDASTLGPGRASRHMRRYDAALLPSPGVDLGELNRRTPGRRGVCGIVSVKTPRVLPGS